VKAAAIALTNLRRLFRQRANIFFVIVLPMLIIMLLGAAFGGGATPNVGIVGRGQLADEIAAELTRTGEVEADRVGDAADLGDEVERGGLQGGLLVPATADAALARGERVTLEYLARPDEQGAQLRMAILAAVTEVGARRRAARFAVSEGLAPYDRALALAAVAGAAVAPVSVRTEVAGEALFPEDVGTFDLGASSQLLLFVFLTSLTGAAALIEVRRLGVSRRMLSTPTSVRTVLAGETLGRYAVALTQGLIIMLGSLTIFGVSWGDPLGAAAVLLVFCLVGAGAGMLVGATLANDQQSTAVGLFLGMGLAALGGSMVPLEVFPDTVRTVAHVTPHAWGNDAFAELVRRGGNLVDVLPELGILSLYAAALLGLASWRLSRSISG